MDLEISPLFERLFQLQLQGLDESRFKSGNGKIDTKPC